MKNSAEVDVEFCLEKIRSVIALISRLLDGDYPHRDSHTALQKLLAVYQKEEQKLLDVDLSLSREIVLEHCRSANVQIVRLKRFLGLLLRSSNLRNAFEIYFPVKMLATELLGKDTSVVLSSEWEFSPFIYPTGLTELPKFVLIGIPASECHNPLILPLAAHELGHAVWRRKNVQVRFGPKIKRQIIDLYRQNKVEFDARYGSLSDRPLMAALTEIYKLATRQLEEIFCDFVGIYVFGEAFLHSFRYLIAPSLGYRRSPLYPGVRTRAEYMVEAAHNYGISGFDDFPASFGYRESESGRAPSLEQRIADEATNALFAELLGLVEKYKGKAECFTEGKGDEQRAFDSLSGLVPVAAIHSLAAIINAAWRLRLDIGEFKVEDDVKLRVLRDLVLKSLEVYEFRKRVEKALCP